MTKYIMFQSSTDKVSSSDCTTRWPSTVSCKIILSGLFNLKYTNLQIMECDNDLDIPGWMAENVGKITEQTDLEMLAVGQVIMPDGTIITDPDLNSFTTTFTVPNGLVLTEVV